MLENYKSIPLAKLDDAPHAIRPDRTDKELTLDDPAISVLTDHRLEQAHLCRSETMLDQAMRQMGKAGCTKLLVSNDQDTVLGIITSSDISGERPIQYTQKTGKKREDLKVKHLMRPISDLPTMSINNVLDARIGDILHTLNNIGSEYILVTTQDKEHTSIRGVFSARRIAKALHIFFDPSPGARTFAEFTKALHNSPFTH
ncbi:CBS domain-containing protein [Bermanella marisrubri]|uniref:CBS domain-containing protein n=1 Tax=Bermanella marisrubri TaxID=207949 RepID=Q1N6W7_9GAMM|nr:CBS domain-containing protein [Bermanella marisrubri]EAT13475.1 hypothetical protein RED65_08794 [Oceanobacter sp. RED65] [Bermanella marisrubri]QIZ84278.1 CBS domain-containing protein [Bermanella marisrubri]